MDAPIKYPKSYITPEFGKEYILISIKILPIKLKRIRKPCTIPIKKPGGSYAVGAG
jgi:hypothetical protein